jgi:hypothetical protein
MGWQPDPSVRITLHFRDDDGAVSLHIINVPAAALPVAGLFAAAYAALYTPISNCALWKVAVSLRYLDDTDPVGAPGSSIYQGSAFLFQTANVPPDRYVVSIPGLVESKLLQPPDPYAGVQLDASDPDIAALVEAMIHGIDGTRPCAPWDVSWGDIGGGGGSWGGGGGGGIYGGGGGGGEWGYGFGGGGGGSWGGAAGGDFTWTGVYLSKLLVAYRGHNRTGFKR